MKVLLTGGSGFLGRHLRRALTDRGDDVDVLDVSGVETPQDVLRALPDLDQTYDLAIHAAAYVQGRAAIEQEQTYLGAYNLQLDAAFFQWALRRQPRHVVYLSSSAVYPVSFQTHRSTTLLRESFVDPQADQQLRPDLTYGFTKLVGERLASELAFELTKTSVHVVRPFSGYGEDQDVSYPFGAFVRRVIGREDPFTVWGTGRQIRDWVHVDDVVGAVLACVDADVCRPVNVCSGVGTTMLRLARLMCDQVGYAPTLETFSEAPAGVARRVGDPSRLREFYVPRVSLEEGIRRAVAS